MAQHERAGQFEVGVRVRDPRLAVAIQRAFAPRQPFIGFDTIPPMSDEELDRRHAQIMMARGN